MAESRATQEAAQKQGQQTGQRDRSLQTTRQGSLTGREQFREFHPFSLMNRFANEMTRLFDDFGFGRGVFAPFSGRITSDLGEIGGAIWSPQVEAFEREGQFIVRADLPGLKKDDVKVDITDDSLIIQGERRLEHEENREDFYRSERSYGSFYRCIPLPEGVEGENAKAEFQDGVLEITLPAPQRQLRRRRIEIGTGSTEQPRAGAQTSSKR